IPPAGAATSRLTLPLLARFLPSDDWVRVRKSLAPVTVAVICWLSAGVTNPLGLPGVWGGVMPTPTGWEAAGGWQKSPAVKATFGATIVPTPGRLLASDTVVPGKPARSVPPWTVASVIGSSCPAHTVNGMSADSIGVEKLPVLMKNPDGASVTV